MASFSSQVKNELVKIEYDKRCCKKSLLYGMALFSKCFSARRMTFQSENENIIILYKKLLKELCNIDCDVTVSPSGRSLSFINDKVSVKARVNLENKECLSLGLFYQHFD